MDDMETIQHPIGPAFSDEVLASPCAGLPFSWGPEGVFYEKDALTAQQVSQLDTLVAAHDPNAQPAPKTGPDDVALDHENRIRALEGQPPITMDDFKKA